MSTKDKLTLTFQVTPYHLMVANENRCKSLMDISRQLLDRGCPLALAAKDCGLENVSASINGLGAKLNNNILLFSLDENARLIIRSFDCYMLFEDMLPMKVTLTEI